MNYLVEKEKQIQITGEFDVIVLGGGPSGVSAAVSASRLGAKTALVERYGHLGGQATGGLVILLVGLTDGKKRIIKGNCEEIINRLKGQNYTQDVGANVLFDPEGMKHLFDCMIIENQIKPYYHSYISDVVFEKNSTSKISSVIIEGKSGRRAISGKYFIDCTGDADIAKYANIPFEQANTKEAQPLTLGFRMGGIDIPKVKSNYNFYRSILEDLGISMRMGGWIHTINKDEAWFNIANFDNIDITNSDSLTLAEIKCRDYIQQIIAKFKSIEGLKNSYLIDTASQIGIRDSRRIKGLYTFSESDVFEEFEDTITRAPNYTRMGLGSVGIPYRCLVSNHADNIIWAGRAISIEHKLIDMIREIPCCIATGQAAGVACAIALKNQSDIKNIDTSLLIKSLTQQGMYTEDTLSGNKLA